MEVRYLDHMGTDLAVVNAARVSFNKESDWEDYCCMCGEMASQHGLHTDPPHYAVSVDDGRTGVLSERDKKLINYLAKHNHFTPFAHPQITLHLKIPIFVARQVIKHDVGFNKGPDLELTVNEVSRRYVDSEPEFYWPTEWRKKAEDKKQGSSEETIPNAGFDIEELFEDAADTYNFLVQYLDVCPEQARMVLPLSTYTEFWMTGSLAAWARFYNLRSKPDTQKETQVVAQQVSDLIHPLFPVSWEALIDRPPSNT